MNRMKLFTLTVVVAIGAAAVLGSMAIADTPKKETKPAAMPEMSLPPGWTQADVQACMMAGAPGDNHTYLAKSAGVWRGTTTMWMFPGSEPVSSPCVSTVTPLMDGRHMKNDYSGEMPGMGPFSGLGIQGFDNVSQKFVSTWIDNQSTGIMYGIGDLSSDKTTLTWTFTYNCPITKKPTVMREIETITGPDTKTLEMFGPDPKTGKEFKMLFIELARTPGGAGK